MVCLTAYESLLVIPNRMFKKLFSLEIGKQLVDVGIGNPGPKNDALYVPAENGKRARIIFRRSILKTPDRFKSILRHESAHVVIDQVEEDFVERIEAAMLRSDAALTTYFAEHPEVL
jgi:hypothetical protein